MDQDFGQGGGVHQTHSAILNRKRFPGPLGAQGSTRKYQSLEELLASADDAWIKAEIAKREAEIAAAEAARAQEDRQAEDHQAESEQKPN